MCVCVCVGDTCMDTNFNKVVPRTAEVQYTINTFSTWATERMEEVAPGAQKILKGPPGGEGVVLSLRPV